MIALSERSFVTLSRIVCFLLGQEIIRKKDDKDDGERGLIKIYEVALLQVQEG